jgi:fatty acid desaturase
MDDSKSVTAVDVRHNGACVGHNVPARLEPEWFEAASLSFGMRVAAWALLVVGGAATASMATHWAGWAVGIVVLGVGMAHGVELTHQALHHTGFAFPALNKLCGIAMGLPMLVSYHEYRIDHLRHHALLGTPEDREFFNYGAQKPKLLAALLRFFMLKHYAQFCCRVVDAWLGRPVGDYPARYQSRVRNFYLLATLTLLCLGSVCVVVGSVRPVLIWFASLLLVASPLHAIIELPEHHLCDRSSTSVFHNTRTIRSNRFMSWLTNNNNFHMEHHLWPNVPVHRVHRLHDRYLGMAQHVEAGYLDFLRRAWRTRFDAARDVYR